jgi:hypothetical protein
VEVKPTALDNLEANIFAVATKKGGIRRLAVR